MPTKSQLIALQKEIADRAYLRQQNILKQLAQQITQNKFKGDDK